MPIGTPVAIGINSGKTNVVTATITVPAGGVPAGASIIVGAATFSTGSVTNIADTAGNSYANNTTGSISMIWSAHNVAALVSGNTITVTWTGTTNPWGISACYVTGLDTSSVYDTGNSATATSASVSLGGDTFTTTQAGEILMAYVAANGPTGDTFTATGSYTALTAARAGTSGGGAGSNMTLNCMYRIVASTNTYDATATITSRLWKVSAGGYKELVAPSNLRLNRPVFAGYRM